MGPKHCVVYDSSTEPPHDKTNKMACAPSEDWDQPGYLPSLISLRCPHEESLGPYYPLSALRRLWSDWVDAQADLSLRWAHMPFCWFCHGDSLVHAQPFIRVRGVVCFLKLPLILLCEQKAIVRLCRCAVLLELSLIAFIISHAMRKPVYAICEQQRHRSACTSAQLDQHLCFLWLDSIIPLVSISEISSL